MLRHLLTTRWNLRRRFPRASLRSIQAAIGAAEREHSGEIRFAIETCLDLRRLWAGESARQRALEVFARLRVWDTEARNGVLIYVLLADRDIEIVADRGFRNLVSPAEWETVCREMEAEFRAGRDEAAALAGIRSVSGLIARHFPRSARDLNELPDAPHII